MFRPWIGTKWGDPTNCLEGVRLLVLGESHYHYDPCKVGTSEAECTTEVVREWALKKPHRFFTGITQVISGKKKWQLNPEELEDVWAAICFYNYVPVYLAGSRERPTAGQFQQGAEPFAKLLEELKPQAILVCGFDLWWWVLNGVGFNGKAWETPFSPIGPALAARMMHPSAAFSSTTWQPVVKSLLEQARARADKSTTTSAGG
jgi:hypothetical protein